MIKIKNEIEILGFNAINYYELGKDFFHYPEKHNYWEMVYIDSGKVNAIVEGMGCVLSQGQVIFHKPNETHSHISNKKDANNLLVVAFTSVSKAMKLFNKRIFTLEKNSKKILSLFIKEAENAGLIPNRYEDKTPLSFKGTEFGSQQLLQCYLIEFLFSLIRSNKSSVRKINYSEDTRRIAQNSTVESIEEFLKNNVYNFLTLKDICDKFKLSKTYLCRIFKAETGQSPIDYFISLKIKEAKKLIREDEYNITQISYMLSYSSIHHFTRMFKKVTGFSPITYKKSIGI